MEQSGSTGCTELSREVSVTFGDATDIGFRSRSTVFPLSVGCLWKLVSSRGRGCSFFSTSAVPSHGRPASGAEHRRSLTGQSCVPSGRAASRCRQVHTLPRSESVSASFAMPVAGCRAGWRFDSISVQTVSQTESPPPCGNLFTAMTAVPCCPQN